MHSFEDPVLKSAIKRAWCSEQCPLALRQRIEAMRHAQTPAASRAGASSGSAAFSMTRRWLIWPIAAAAAIALAVGVKMLLQSSPAPSAPLAIALPASLETSLIQTHEHCCHGKNHHYLDAATASDAEVAKKMQARLSSQAVLVAHPPDSAWQYMGAAICPVGGTPAGHLVFAKGDDTISIFSLPESVAPQAKDGAHFEMTADGHPIVAFTKNGGLFCLVGTSPSKDMTVNQLAEMRDQMQSDVIAAAAHAEEGTALAELLYTPSH